MKFVRILSLLAGMAAVAACVPRSEPSAPPPQPAPEPRPAPSPPSPPPAPQDWRDAPLTQGGWTYDNQGGSSQAAFGPQGGAPHFVVRCDRAGRQILLSRAGAANGAAMTVRTTFGARNFPVSARAGAAAASLSADDRFLDSMSFSRGRFTVEMAGAPTLFIPAWPEPARVIEDCRG